MMLSIEKLLKMRKAGKSLQEIAVNTNVSRQRVHQILGNTGRRVLGHGRASRNQILWQYKDQAKKRGHSWNLSESQFDRLVSSNCSYCGVEPSNVYGAKAGWSKKSSPFTYSGIDRKDNTKGYTTKNAVSCCKICNRAKGVLTLVEWNQWLTRIRNKA